MAKKTNNSESKKSFILVIAILGVITLILTSTPGGPLSHVSTMFRSNNFDGNFWKSNSPMMGMVDEYYEDDIQHIKQDSVGFMEVSENEMVAGMAVGSRPSKMMVVPPTIGGRDDALEIENRVYEKSANFQVVVKDVNDYTRQMKEYILSIDGRVLSSHQNTSDRYNNSFISAKIPVAKFEESTSRITENVKKVISESINAQDRTGSQVAVQSNLERLQEQKLEQEIMLEEARTEAEKKRIELTIKRLERQIINAEKSVKNVEAKVEYASISINASNSEKYYNPRPINSPDFLETLSEAWRSVSQKLIMIAMMAIWVIVYSLLWLPLVLAIKFVWGKFGKN